MLYAKHAYNHLGSDYTCIARDLKTFRGIESRICKGAWPCGMWNVYRCSPDSFYDESKHEHVGTFLKVKRIGGVR